MPRLISNLAADYPKLHLKVRESQTAHLVADILDYKLDVALVALPIGEERLEELVLAVDEFILAAPKDHPFAALKLIDQQALAGSHMLLLEEGHLFARIKRCRFVP